VDEVIVLAAVFLNFGIVRDSSWQSEAWFHTLQLKFSNLLPFSSESPEFAKTK
jgi:hypothetical protein